MLWGKSDYERMTKLVHDIYFDYGLRSFPVDEREVCRKLGVKLIPYSEFDGEYSTLLKQKSADAFYIPATTLNPPMILYNDDILSKGRVRFSIFHEIKHYVNHDVEETPYNEDMADFFARYFMCPIPYLVRKNYADVFAIMSDFSVSMEVASNVASNIKNRVRCYGGRIFENEKPFLKYLMEDDYYDDS